MKISIKTKMIANGCLSIGLSITLAMVIVYVLIRNQSQKSAIEKVDQVVHMVSGQVDKITGSLLNVTTQIGKHQDWGEKINFIQQNKNEEIFQNTINEQKADLANALNQIAQASDIPEIILYDSDGDLVCGIILDEQNSNLFYPKNSKRGEIIQAIVPLGETPEMGKWASGEMILPINKKHDQPFSESPILVSEAIDEIGRASCRERV